MRYIYAKELHEGDQVKRKSDQVVFVVNSIELFGQYKKVKLNCVAENGMPETLFNDEIE
jgi:hypothetical protein